MKPRWPTCTHFIKAEISEFGLRPTDTQHAIEDFLLLASVLRLQRRANTIALIFHRSDSSVKQDAVEHFLQTFVKRKRQIAVRAGEQSGKHFDDSDASA